MWCSAAIEPTDDMIKLASTRTCISGATCLLFLGGPARGIFAYCSLRQKVTNIYRGYKKGETAQASSSAPTMRAAQPFAANINVASSEGEMICSSKITGLHARWAAALPGGCAPAAHAHAAAPDGAQRVPSIRHHSISQLQLRSPNLSLCLGLPPPLPPPAPQRCPLAPLPVLPMLLLPRPSVPLPCSGPSDAATGHC